MCPCVRTAFFPFSPASVLPKALDQTGPFAAKAIQVTQMGPRDTGKLALYNCTTSGNIRDCNWSCSRTANLSSRSTAN